MPKYPSLNPNEVASSSWSASLPNESAGCVARTLSVWGRVSFIELDPAKKYQWLKFMRKNDLEGAVVYCNGIIYLAVFATADVRPDRESSIRSRRAGGCDRTGSRDRVAHH